MVGCRPKGCKELDMTDQAQMKKNVIVQGLTAILPSKATTKNCFNITAKIKVVEDSWKKKML